VKILIDMNLSPRWVQYLAREGFEALHWSSIGPPDAEDAEIMAFAANHQWVVLTHDLDFGAILAASNGNQPSVIQLRTNDLNPATLAYTVSVALRQLTHELTVGALVTIHADRARLRVLPLSGRPQN
jgi:predicted nuclease of predicted toxin-antitoxin system